MRRLICTVSGVAIVSAVQAAVLANDRTALLGMFLVSVGIAGYIAIIPALSCRVNRR